MYRIFLVLSSLLIYSPILVAIEQHGISMHGQTKLSAHYEQFSYTDNQAIKAGKITHARIGSFDSLNPFVIHATAPDSINNYVFESLLIKHFDEPFALYGLLAKNIVMPAHRQSITFTLHEDAKFSDGHPVNADDVIFSYETLKKKGRPNHRYYYNKVKRIEKIGSHKILFTFDETESDQEMPLIIGLMPILPQHIYQDIDFTKTGHLIPIGSGPYVIKNFTIGKQVNYAFNENYWGKNKAFSKNRNNIKQLTFDYYRDENSAFEAFKSGLIDIWIETDPLRWKYSYNFSAVKDGKIIKENVPTQTPSGLLGFVFNTRNKLFSDINVRHALTEMFNFEWVNKTFYANHYIRTQSYFGKSDLTSHLHSIKPEEQAILGKATLSTHVKKYGYSAPKGDIRGYNRQARNKALRLMTKAGYEVKNGEMRHKETKYPFEFEILVQTQEHKRLALAYQHMLRRIGIKMIIRYIDSSQYQMRLHNFNYDMIIHNWYVSLSPGKEQAFYWGSEAATQHGSRNYTGLKNIYVDQAITALTTSKNRNEFIMATRALDRLIMDGNYVIPLFYRPHQWVAHWNHVKHSDRHSIYGVQFDTWWVNQDE